MNITKYEKQKRIQLVDKQNRWNRFKEKRVKTIERYLQVKKTIKALEGLYRQYYLQKIIKKL